MRAEANVSRKVEPANPRMAGLATIPEGRIVHLRMTGDALGSGARSDDVASVVTVLALRLAVPCREAQSRMIPSDVGDLSPVGFVVTGSALFPGKGSLVRVFVTGDAVRLEAKIGRRAATIATIVAVVAARRRVSASERPTRSPMIETLSGTAWPPDDLRAPPKVLDVTAPALLPAILASVQALLLTYPNCQIIVAPEAGFGVDPLAGRVAFAAVRIAFEVGMGAAELSRGEELCAGWPWRQRSEDRSRGHHHA
jgi:hypothetical protein